MKTTISAQYLWEKKTTFCKTDVQYVCSERSAKISHATCNWTLFAILFRYDRLFFFMRTKQRKHFNPFQNGQWKIEKHSSWIRKQKMSSSTFVLHMKKKIEKKRSSKKYWVMLWNIRLLHLKLPKWLNYLSYTKMTRSTMRLLCKHEGGKIFNFGMQNVCFAHL